jgi:predicted amidohydrolase
MAQVPKTLETSVKVAAVQFRSSFDVPDNQRRMIEVLVSLSKQGVRIAVFPECALTGYQKSPDLRATPEQVTAAEEQIGRACRMNRIAAVFGSIYWGKAKVYDTAVAFDSHGELKERYGKLQLAAEKWASPGNHIALFNLEGITSTVIVCHDERYPELVRLPALKGARIVYYISSESSLLEENKLMGYRAQMMARAVENGMFIVAANTPASPRDLSGSHGQSRIINPDGRVLKEASFFGEDILIETLSVSPGKLERPLEGLMGEWWQDGIDIMMKNRLNALE